MKKHILLICNLVIIITIVTCFVWMLYKDTRAYQELAEKHLENILSLADTDISKHIENSMTKPVMVSKTMANDRFLKEWILKEPENLQNSEYLEQLYAYLKAYQEKYGYNTVFCVSANTGNYYYQEGLNKTVSRDDAHDVWFYNFIDSGREYDIQIDTNEYGGGGITMFVNFRMVGDDGSLLAVIGVGLLVDSLESTLSSYEKDYGLSVYIINAGGAENSFKGSTAVFIAEDELASRVAVTDEIKLNKSPEPEMQWFTSGGERKCLIMKYNDTLGWYQIIEKDTSSISRSFQSRIKSSIIFMLISLAVCLLVTTCVFNLYNRQIIIMANTDELTGLPNRTLFNRLYPSFLRKRKSMKNTLFILDIDHFKSLNDTWGHLFGNAILAMVGKNLSEAIKGCGIASRWGGDEFLGILAVEAAEAERILSGFMDSLTYAQKDELYRVSVSVGLAEFGGKLGADVIKQADKRLYAAKANGRGGIA